MTTVLHVNYISIKLETIENPQSLEEYFKKETFYNVCF